MFLSVWSFINKSSLSATIRLQGLQFSYQLVFEINKVVAWKLLRQCITEMEDKVKFTDCSRNKEVTLSAQTSGCGTHLSFPQCSLQLGTSTVAKTTLGNRSAQTKPISKADKLRKKRKQKSKNIHLKAVTTKSHAEINTRDGSSRPRNSLKNKRQETCNEGLNYKHATGTVVITGPRSHDIVKKVSVQSKVSLKAWPSRSCQSKKDGSEVLVKQKRPRSSRLLKTSVPSHRCFDFASESTIQACCLSSAQANHRRVKRRIVGQKEIQEKSPESVVAPSTTNELPGFYYDPDKRRYFKIVPSSNNCMSNVVTQERIAFERNEKLRQEELASLAATGQLNDPNHQTTAIKTENIFALIDRRMRGIKFPTQEVGTYQLRRICIEKLRPRAGKGSEYLNSPDSPRAIIQKMKIYSKENQLLIFCSTDARTSTMELRKIGNFRILRNDDSSGREVGRSFAVDLEDDHLIFSSTQWRRVADMCFATAGEDSLVVPYCVNDDPINTSGIHVFRCTASSPRSKYDLRFVNQVKQYMMCCASTSDKFAVGTECCALLGNYAKLYPVAQLCTFSSAIHALTFANTSSKVLFCAAKSGRILTYDERSGRKPVAYLTEREGFSFDLHMTKDDRYLLSAISNGKQIEKWDLRQGRVVVNYPGHVTECARTPLVVDQREEFISAVGSDSYTRIWDLKTGELLKVLPPPLPATKQNKPSVCFVDLYGHSRNNYPGVLLGMSNELHFYSF